MHFSENNHQQPRWKCQLLVQNGISCPRHQHYVQQLAQFCCITHEFQVWGGAPRTRTDMNTGWNTACSKELHTKPVQCVQPETHKIQTNPLCTLLQFFPALSDFWKLAPQHCAKTVIPLFQPDPSQYPPKRHLLNSKGKNKSCQLICYSYV